MSAPAKRTENPSGTLTLAKGNLFRTIVYFADGTSRPVTVARRSRRSTQTLSRSGKIMRLKLAVGR